MGAGFRFSDLLQSDEQSPTALADSSTYAELQLHLHDAEGVAYQLDPKAVLQPDPDGAADRDQSANALTKNALGIYTRGYGVINAFQAPNTVNLFDGTTAATGLASRSGAIVGRFSF